MANAEDLAEKAQKDERKAMVILGKISLIMSKLKHTLHNMSWKCKKLC